MSALNNLREKGTSLTMGENELLAERVRRYPRLYDKTCKEHKKRKNKGLKRKGETMVSWPIKKAPMPSPNVRCISPALHIICVIKT